MFNQIAQIHQSVWQRGSWGLVVRCGCTRSILLTPVFFNLWDLEMHCATAAPVLPDQGLSPPDSFDTFSTGIPQALWSGNAL